jgi:(E)-4-hydroxy-3-methylbut-2-enyl-diphosphate synthase
MIQRRQTKIIKLGNLLIGGDNPISIQSMTNTDTRDKKNTLKQINDLRDVGCEIVRLAVPDQEAAEALSFYKKNTDIPLIGDIHFDHKLAISSIQNGIDGLRINPGNIGSSNRVKQIIEAAKDRMIPIRIGVNSGSLSKRIIKKYGGVTVEGIVESALEHVTILENLNYHQIKISVKTSSVPLTLGAYRLLSQKTDYPLHLGITEAGSLFRGTIKSAIGIGILLAEGIGDTIRVSLTADPVQEVKVAQEILKALHLKKGLQIISCPTCGRTEIDLISIANQVEEALKDQNDKDITVAVMGCMVNGPGEAREADYGLAGGNGEGLIFKKGKIFKKVPEQDLVKELIAIIEADV